MKNLLLCCVVCGSQVSVANKSKKICCSLDCRKKFLEKTKPQICKACGNTFGDYSQRKYCSSACRNAGQVREHFYICLNCSKPYLAKNINRNKYCSRECAFSHKSQQAAELRATKPASEKKEHEKKCNTCGQSFIAKRADKKYCSVDCSRIANLHRKYPPVAHSCLECGKDFAGHKSAKYCCEACAKKALKRERKHKIRAGGPGYSSAITIELLGSRDGWNCGICGEKIKHDAPRVYPDGPSIDHIIPISKGGKHNWANVQIAHIGCNVKKSNKITVSRIKAIAGVDYANA